MRSEPDETAGDGIEAEPPGDGVPVADDSQAPDPASGADEARPTTDLAPVPDGPGAQVDRLTDVLLAADQAAAEILDAAREEASEFVAETQRSTVERAESLRRETDNLMAQTAELTAKVVELTRATEQVMEGFRAELSLDAPEVREETLTPALPEPAPIAPQQDSEPEPPPAPIEDVAPEDTALAPEPLIDEPVADEQPPADEPEAPVLDEPQVVEEPPPSTPVVETPAADSAGAPATTEVASVSPTPAAESAADAPASPEPKRRGLFGRLRGRGKDHASPQPPPSPEPAPSRTEESPVPDARSGPVTEGARLIARQMLATGLGEEEVKRQLREQFRLADPQAVLDSLRRNDRDDQSG